MKTYITDSYEETVALGEHIAENLPKGSVIAFVGGLGMGKTAFTTGLVKGLGIEADVSSPTFAICNTYIGNENALHHFDMYRVDGWDDLYSTGFFDFLETDCFMAVEWSENVYGALPDDAVIIEFERLDENSRQIKIYKKYEEE
ncbi:MAG: tRNA (adenosine(37)-N6)-threonylcarbamoyltransferase complex ATPase subunit type 1 TsaE [Acetobacter sp.]|nr:tRNA (adenosine(37)-N6)-threonylcarbamoyltransferase complex ATPase subunit type 1 TsaE [Bacteroides sp.]MCM1341340.1 tRNA (adenosine(37)-N6)-threonylcarbamoyltransferase complex ATPase subunit type 1 TsaE [Acetobacter sp.]MCM1433432.1 tRNA (adenosine(37)-N6)-threonylcarbamoyltransferase complex ATPase subunit type 1 TsaE [Clostridiales bacterium]